MSRTDGQDSGVLRVEVQPEGGHLWTECGRLGEASRAGSLSDVSGGRRDIILFRCRGPYSLVERSLGGADAEAGAGRVVVAEGTEVLATLRAGESFETTVTTDRGSTRRVRWTHLGAG